jgi:hypothetical protein
MKLWVGGNIYSDSLDRVRRTPLCQVVVNSLLQADVRAHAALPDQGNATVANFGVSSLA